MPEYLIQMVAGISQFFRTGYGYTEIFQFYDTFQMRHSCFIQVLPYLIAYEQQAGFRVVYNIVYLIGFEFM